LNREAFENGVEVMKKILSISELSVNDIEVAGGKGANLGELTEAGFKVPPGFVLTTAAYDYFLKENGIEDRLHSVLSELDVTSDKSLRKVSEAIFDAFMGGKIPSDLEKMIIEEFDQLYGGSGEYGLVAVRSSATAEDLPTASFAGQQETFLNVHEPDDLLEKVKKCWASLFTPRAIAYRATQGFEHEKVKLAVIIQKMVRSEISGIMFTIDPNSELPHIIIEAGYGLGEALVSGKVTPDTYVVEKFHKKIINKRVAKQTWKLIRGETGETVKVDVEENLQKAQKMTDEEILAIAEIGNQVELHYDRPMDIEWATDYGELVLVQARPITTLKSNSSNINHVAKGGGDVPEKKEMKGENIITKGLAASPGRASGKVTLLADGMSLDVVKSGDILVTRMTTPDMVPAMTRAVAIVTDEGGMTCHAAIVARELGIPCVVGTSDATKKVVEDQLITVDGNIGIIIEGGEEKAETVKPAVVAHASVPTTGTKILVNIGIPQKAEEYAQLPVQGVGLMRIEFLFTSYVEEHPQSLIEQGRGEELVDKLAEGLGIVGRAFYPRPVVVRTSDFKTNEYREMKGGEAYEPEESNPMIGWRGCSRYVSEEYRDAYKLELKALKKARDEMGLKNLWVMLPFVRTVEELKVITGMMDEVGLKRNRDLKLYLMAEIPCNIFMAEEFADYCDGFSIGSNDLTQLIMGADRDSEILGRMGYFDERNEAIKRAISHLIKVAHSKGKVVSICGQAPSVYPEFTEFLVREGIDSISLNPDTVIKTLSMVASTEQRIILESLRKTD
jgi:pyruvate,water dikinase